MSMLEATSERHAAAPGPNLMEVDRITMAFGSVLAVHDTSLGVEPGETLGLLGANGAGKSTLYGVIGGQHRPTSGRVRLRGEDVTGMAPARLARRGVTRCFQVARVYSSFTVRMNLALAMQAGRPGALSPLRRPAMTNEDRDRIDDALKRADLDRLADKVAHEISEGDRKRLDVARALVRDSSLLLLDEPTAGLSSEGVAQMIELVRIVRRLRPKTGIVLTAHDLQVVRELVDRAVLMVHGQIKVRGSIGEVLRHPITVQSYLGGIA